MAPFYYSNQEMIVEYRSIIRAAIPNATEHEIDFILWERTPYPVGVVTPKELYKAASRISRASKNRVRLCELCDNRAELGSYTCSSCSKALSN